MILAVFLWWQRQRQKQRDGGHGHDGHGHCGHGHGGHQHGGHSGYFSGVYIFQGWIFFRGEYL